MKDNTKRFSDRVEDYIRYRPTYPKEIIDILEEEIQLDKSKIIADIGSGTGISSQLFLENDLTVIGVEPNKEMREAAEQILLRYVNFKSVNGSAENTNLQDRSIDMIFCGQAFHWFDKEKGKIEFERILKNNGNIVLVWNSRNSRSSFMNEYEKTLKEQIPEYEFVNHRNITDEEISNFFLPKKMNKICLDNEQILDLNGLKGRLKSSSYCPKSGILYEELMSRIEKVFEKFKINNTIEFEYETQIFWC
jgi:ubiquinone/menaquinone biosynthesis C-methylase UbiE